MSYPTSATCTGGQDGSHRHTYANPAPRAARKAVATRKARQLYRKRYGLVCPSRCQARHHEGEQKHHRDLGTIDGQGCTMYLQLEQHPYQDPILCMYELGLKKVGVVRIDAPNLEHLWRQVNIAMRYIA